jgi:hypothetical protein
MYGTTNIKFNKVSFIYKILFKSEELDTVKFRMNAILTHCIL